MNSQAFRAGAVARHPEAPFCTNFYLNSEGSLSAEGTTRPGAGPFAGASWVNGEYFEREILH